ncbi:MAG: amino acid adenylation domain-containing protein [Myxococcales bacterium]|nr:amino acid adenylation domain-containing protein [Myxococcales bacterium]
MSAAPRSLHGGFLAASERHPERPALEVGGEVHSYASLRARALAVAATLQATRGAEGPPLTCVLAQRSAGTFVGVLGALCSGHGYVPLLPSDPVERVARMIDRAEARALIVDAAGQRQLAKLLPRIERPLIVLSLEAAFDEAARAAHPRHTLLDARDLAPESAWAPPPVDPDAVAYLLFTSGSTGEPKGVMVAHRNIAHFLDVVIDRYALGPDDRFTHLFEVTFDLSLFDMFAAWTVGACLCVPDARQRLLPSRYVAEAKVTVWFSVPSAALLMKETRTLTPGSLPGLRLALFCGEALTATVAEAFARAAQNAIVENLYGPTELTVACALYRVEDDVAARSVHDVVPIGAPFPGMRARVVDDALAEVAPGERGELLMTGPQVTLGYWRDPARTRAAFVTPPGESALFYRTGDRVIRPRAGEPMIFLGRLDSQVKIRGFRVELGEIEAALREEAGVDAAVALAWPVSPSGVAEGVVAFLDDASVDTRALLQRVGKRLPRHMIPRQVHLIDAFPLNRNGKIDRGALRRSLS